MQYYLLGSTRFVQDHPQFRPEAFILLDMVGGKQLSIPMEDNGLRLFPDLTLKVFSRASMLGLPAFDASPGRSIYDDHIPFLRAGIPSVDLIDLDYRQWHTLQDDLAACSARSLQQVGELMVALLYLDFPMD
jgi:Zn-dependent M28 family amino/carboxypeptidase